MVKFGVPGEILIQIARASIYKELFGEYPAGMQNSNIEHPQLDSRIGSFVTIYHGGNLKGCIGRIEGERTLAEDIAQNAIDAAFHDFRFPPLQKEGYPRMKVEISILTKPKKIKFNSEKELFEKLLQKKPGVILEYHKNRSTYLPQVWEHYHNSEAFMGDLASKGGFEYAVWNQKDCQVLTYEALVFHEK